MNIPHSLVRYNHANDLQQSRPTQRRAQIVSGLNLELSSSRLS